MTWQTIGFPKQKKYFEGLVKDGRLAHAYLFTGPEMIGKKMFAKELYALANIRQELNAAYPDLKVIAPNVKEGETKIYPHTKRAQAAELPRPNSARSGVGIYIEDIRDLKSFLSLKPYYGPYKFVIIDEADRLTPEASNGLLKLLEEPTPNTVLILISAHAKSLLATISSRCQHINFLPHNVEAVQDYLATKKISKSDQALLISMAQGRVGWIESAVARISEIKKNIEEFEKATKGGIAERINYAKKIYEKETYHTVVADCLYWAYGNSAVSEILRELNHLEDIISQPQYNHRLAIENALLSI